MAARSPGWFAATSFPVRAATTASIADRNHRRLSRGRPGERRAQDVRAHAAAGSAAPDRAEPVAIYRTRHGNARRRIRGGPDLRCRLSRARSEGRRLRSRGHTRSRSASSSMPTPPRATRCRESPSRLAGASRRPVASSDIFSTRDSTRTSAADGSSTASSIRWAGAGRGSFNHRFGQQSRDQLQHFNILYPVDMFPFTDADATGSETGVTDALLAKAREERHRAQLFHLLTNSEYFNRAGSLVHTDPTGTRDIAPPAAVESTSSHRPRTSSARFHRRRFRIPPSSARPT